MTLAAFATCASLWWAYTGGRTHECAELALADACSAAALVEHARSELYAMGTRTAATGRSPGGSGCS